jgi:hypothetical protein
MREKLRFGKSTVIRFKMNSTQQVNLAANSLIDG